MPCALADRDKRSPCHAAADRPPPLVADHAARWWAEVNVQARDALAGGDPGQALALVQHAGFTAGDQYAEQQFLAGFIALRFLKDPRHRAGPFPAAGRRRRPPHQQVAGAILAGPRL